MPRLLALPLLSLALTSCVNDLGTGSDEPGDRGASRPITGENPDAPNDEPGPGPGDDEPAPGDDEPAPGDDELPPDPEDPDGDGVVQFGDPGPPPSEAAQSCVEWTDCGPHYADPNSGFDCVDSTCTCDDTGQWATACAGIGGSWSVWECFCFVGTDGAMPASTAFPPPDAVADGEDVVCWWRWKDLGCDPDEWVDTSYYEQVCDSHGCWNDYVEDGYYIDGECHGRWVRRCSNGYEYY